MAAAPTRTTPVVQIVTAHGRQELEGRGDERLVDLLARHAVPWSAVAAYVVPRDGGDMRLCPSLDRRLDTFPDAAEILLYFNRNVNPFLFALGSYKLVEGVSGGDHATDYFYQKYDNDRSTAETFLKQLSPEECRFVIAERVADMVRASMPEGGKLVVGVSGGGDSNAMLHGLTQLAGSGVEIHPVIIMGIPDWDLGVPRARELCATYGLDLTVIEEAQVGSLLGIAPGTGSLIDRFEREFKGDDFEFLGTLLIRLALMRHARDIGASFIATGLNLEDVLCEALFRVSNGMKPAPFPARDIGEVKLLFPLWLCPKRIIDGCFPKFSLQNYEARYPCFSLGRNLYYSVVYAVQSQFPGFAEQLARGLSQVSLADPVRYTFDEQLGFHVERFVPFPLRQRFQRMIADRQTLS